ncbi:MAG: hypothetical protein IPJ88_09030 [Myxococcales bacterium]|nr:MAG: hypothetical protein IPJ88_09030 [Myxococcales bacterium]
MSAEAQQLSIKDLVGSLRRRSAHMPYEIGVFVALETCEQIQRSPSTVDSNRVLVGVDGHIQIQGQGIQAEQHRVARSVVEMLGELLLAAAPGVPENIVALVESARKSTVSDLNVLRDDLLSRLVPLNRQASRRILARLLREAARDTSLPKGLSRFDQEAAESTESPRDIISDIDDLLDSLPPAAPPEEKLPGGVADSMRKDNTGSYLRTDDDSPRPFARKSSAPPPSPSEQSSAPKLNRSDWPDEAPELPLRGSSMRYKILFWSFAAVAALAIATGTILLLR